MNFVKTRRAAKALPSSGRVKILASLCGTSKSCLAASAAAVARLEALRVELKSLDVKRA